MDLRSTNLTDKGIKLLCLGLKDNRTILELNLSKNDITAAGIEHFAFVLWKTGIQELDISLNPLGNAGVKYLAENGLFMKI